MIRHSIRNFTKIAKICKIAPGINFMNSCLISRYKEHDISLQQGSVITQRNRIPNFCATYFMKNYQKTRLCGKIWSNCHSWDILIIEKKSKILKYLLKYIVEIQAKYILLIFENQSKKSNWTIQITLGKR